MAQSVYEQAGQQKWLIGAIVVALLIGVFIWRLVRPDTPALSPTPAQPTQTAFESPPAAVVEAPPVPAAVPMAEPPATPVAPPPPPLPSLDESDREVKTALAELPGGIDRLVTDEFLVRKAARAIAAMADGELVNQYRPLQNPNGAFLATRDGDTYQLDQANFDRYTPYVEAALAAGPERLLALYQRYYPLLDEAYRELGDDGADFEAAVTGAIDQMLAVNGDVDTSLERPTVMYKFRDPDVEALPAAQKLMLRIGPDNRQRLKPLLESLRQQITRG